MNAKMTPGHLKVLGRQDLEDAIAETAHLRTYGYAPGNYMCRCSSGDENCPSTGGFGITSPQRGHFIGAKLSWRCRPCAEKMHAEALAAKKQDRQVRMPQLVRDLMVPREGIKEENHRVSDALAVALLVGKLHAEAAELSLDLTNPDEYGDVYEILLELARRHNVTLKQIVEAADRKRAVKGAFNENNLWVPEDYV